MQVRTRLSLDDYGTIRRLAAMGATHWTIARALRVHENTWARIRRRDARAREAYRAGRGELCPRPLLGAN